MALVDLGKVTGDIVTNITNPTDGQVLKYDGTSGKWVNAEGGTGSGTLVVNSTYDSTANTYTLDKTWQEINDNAPNVLIASVESDIKLTNNVMAVGVSDGGVYTISCAHPDISSTTARWDLDTYVASSPNDYPVLHL